MSMGTIIKRVLKGVDALRAVESLGPASWLWHPDLSKDQPAVVRFQLAFESAGEPVTFHVSADQRFHLHLDGESLVRGPDNGDPGHWAFSTYALEVTPGAHTLTAEVWWIGEHAPLCRMTLRGGFILKAEGVYHERLTTGVAPWQVTHVAGYGFSRWEAPHYLAFGDEVCVDGRLREKGVAKAAEAIGPAEHFPHTGYFYNKWILEATTLPDQFRAKVSCGTVRAVFDRVMTGKQPVTRQDMDPAACCRMQRLVDGQEDLVIPARSERSFLCDLNDYYCAYPQLTVSGGRDAVISWGWSEALFLEDHKEKGNRDQVEGLFFFGMTDRFIANGEPDQAYETLWWRAGRYILITVKTEGEALTLHPPRIMETRYPLENASRFHCDDARMDDLQKLCFRGLQMNSHEHAMDCPYYEQLMYVGDTRLQVLIQYVTSRDDRLLRRCIKLFNWSRARGVLGLTTSRYPDRHTQWIPPFSLIWVWMVHDYFLWREDMDFVKGQLMGTRSVLNAYSTFLNADHLIGSVPHWPFADWTPAWGSGCPPGAKHGVSAIMNLTYLLALEKAIEMEKALGNPMMAAAYDHQRALTATAVRRAFWSVARDQMADDEGHEHYSEHLQALIILSDSFDEREKGKALHALLHASDLARTSSYFSYYLFEALFKMRAVDTVRDRLEAWPHLVKQGFKTAPEEFGHTRSDCHAWSSHPLYHLHASVLGIAPAEPGFRSVVVRPQDVGWKDIGGKTVHPNGLIESEFHFAGASLEGRVTLPGIGGRLEWRGQTVSLKPGENTIRLSIGA